MQIFTVSPLKLRNYIMGILDQIFLMMVLHNLGLPSGITEYERTDTLKFFNFFIKIVLRRKRNFLYQQNKWSLYVPIRILIAFYANRKLWVEEKNF